jgi:hypothetical protein
MSGAKKVRKPTTRALSAQQTAKIISQMARLLAQPGVANLRAVEALEAAATIIAAGGSRSITSLIRLRGEGVEEPGSPPSLWLSDLTTEEARRRIRDPQTSKKELLDIALVRFGIPRSRLAKMSYEEAADAVFSAAANEDSLEIIAANADESGRQRQA